MHKEKTTIDTISLVLEKHLWLIAIPVLAILCFVFWQIGQEIGADLGRFIYNLKH